jgi:hypothetical protein
VVLVGSTHPDRSLALSPEVWVRRMLSMAGPHDDAPANLRRP